MSSPGELVRRIAAGRDAAAETELCRAFASRIRLYGLKHLRDEERARDLVQAVLVIVLEAARAGRIADPDLVDRFVLGTARLTAQRMRDRDRRAEPVDPATLDLEAIAPRLAEIDVEALMRCLSALETRAQTVVQLSFYRDQSADEIAAVLATSAGNVRVLRHRAIAQLRDCLSAREAA